MDIRTLQQLVSVYYPMNYRYSGPVPDDANGVTERACDECGGSGTQQ